jgi:predicted lipoprotein with Yx(FWY)xxD motif
MIGGCKDGDSSTPTIQVFQHAAFGKILTNGDGFTLYFFSRDTKDDSSSCTTSPCTDNWPAYYSENVVFESSELDEADFTVMTRSDGAKQTAYKGWPLYTYAGDSLPGQANGEKFMNVWYVAKPDYFVMYAKGQLVGHNGISYKSDYTEGTEETFYLTDDRGRTLYTFSADSNGQSKYTGSVTQWPKFTASGNVPGIFDQSDFGIAIDTQQITFRGWPLYYFGGNATVAGDAERGETRGVSFPPNQPAGFWPVANTGTVTAP